MESSKVESQTTCVEEEDCVKIVALNEDQEETMDNSEVQNTQYVLEVEPASKKKKLGKGKMQVNTQKKTIMNNGLIKWLENFWQTEGTLRVMKPFLKAINDAALKSKKMKLFNVGQTLQKIMKEFFIYMKTQQKDLTDCSYSIFEEWCLKDGLSMTFGKLQSMEWENDLGNLLFDHYSTVLTELEARQEQMDEAEEASSTSRGYLSSRNMKSTSTLSTTAHTVDQHAVASISKDSEITRQVPAAPRKSKNGQLPKQVTFPKERLASTKRKILDMDTDNEEEYTVGHLFKTNLKKTVEEESEPEVELRAPKRKIYPK